MTIFNFFQSYFHNAQLAAVYIRSQHSCYQLTFYYLDSTTGLPTYKVNDTDFFKQVAKQYRLGKNTFTQQLDRLHPDGSLGKIAYVEKTGQLFTEYIVIKNLNYYL